MDEFDTPACIPTVWTLEDLEKQGPSGIAVWPESDDTEWTASTGSRQGACAEWKERTSVLFGAIGGGAA